MSTAQQLRWMGRAIVRSVENERTQICVPVQEYSTMWKRWQEWRMTSVDGVAIVGPAEAVGVG